MATKDLLISIKIKQEKVDPEIENKINSIAINIKEEPNNEQSPKLDDKKAVEPVKSSNEILAELFKVFNAEPPKELLDDKSLAKLAHRQRKNQKKKKHKKDAWDSPNRGTEQEEDDSKIRKSAKKKKKDKEKSRHKLKDEIKKEKHRKEYKSSETNDLPSKLDKKNEKMNIQIENVPIKTENSQKKIGQEPHQSLYVRDNYMSDVSLSDEETYLKERQKTIHHKPYNSFYGKQSRSRSRSRDREHKGRRERDARRPYKCRSRSRSRELKIDKKRLLEIARKNAISMFKRGNLPGSDGMSEEIKDKVLLKMRYGGRTVQDLTDFCKKISNGENLSDLSSDEDSDIDKNGNAKAFHHPFLLKEREPIVMQIRNYKSIVPRPTQDQTKPVTMQFPVSSGQQHRMTEAWIPVDPKDTLPSLPNLPVATQSTNIFKTTKAPPKNVFEKQLPLNEKQEPAFKPVMDNTQLPAKNNEIVEAAVTMGNRGNSDAPPAVPISPPQGSPFVQPPVPIMAPQMSPFVPPPVTVIAPPFVPDVPIPSTTAQQHQLMNSGIPSDGAIDVSSIISKRLNAMRRLQENPMDSEAQQMMQNSQHEMSTWASSKHIPGQFTGSTGANILKAHELNAGPQVWARRDQLTSTKPFTGGMGMLLLQKMGWKPGEGLGREKTGSLQPLLLDVKLDKHGLVAKEENNPRRPQGNKKPRGNNVTQAQQNIQDKHPVCLLNELTSKRKWTPPLYTIVNETGPSHGRMFLFSVSINGQVFTPNQASNTKKEAKMMAARHCLQQIGILS